ncbi:hypothetical protein pdam_00022118 [Pocillopora damicornis]|uniref:Ig-like domain-containing protein n=1 Tax=Pocillopora damicornis TaxID=46731 RepID=A0A3M6T6W4_POCDA|nr:contactin-2-like [Pocillopora damicornis]RMX37048.1 hypothetical protein pdam_00022118 [Pocillopora damicornis]
MTFRGAVFITCILGHYYLISGVTALKPRISVVDKAVVAQKGSTVTLMCSAKRVRKLTTSSSWEFNGQEIKKRNNKIVIPEPHYQTNKRKGNFTLTIKNVSDTDVGTYTCKVSKINLDAILEAKENIELSLQDEAVSVILPVVKALRSYVVTSEGSNITLTCIGRRVKELDTMVKWKFEGQEIEESSNKKAIVKFLPKRRGNFSLHITNVSKEDIGNYSCVASTADFGKAIVKETFIHLNLFKTVSWPRGTYALPMPNSGCPITNEFTWSAGYHRQDTEETGPRSSWSSPLHLKGDKTPTQITQHFCVKTIETGGRLWPSGQYCIYRKGTCPDGFQEGEIKWDDEDTKNDNMAEGILPDGEYKKDTTLQFCCRSDGSAENPIELPIREPFFLLKHSGRCQVVLGMRVTEEWLFWDCEDRENKNSYNGEVPASFITKDVKLHYCYYEKQ